MIQGACEYFKETYAKSKKHSLVYHTLNHLVLKNRQEPLHGEQNLARYLFVLYVMTVLSIDAKSGMSKPIEHDSS